MGTWKKAILEGDSALLPTGGTTGQVLAKNSATNYDVAWTTVSGASSNSFETIAVSGQSPVVADSATDTLTLVAGSNITITTNATTDEITIASSGGGTPAGSNGQIQFNNSSSFGADSNLFWDNTNKRIGIGTSSPSSAMSLRTTSGSSAITIMSTAAGGSNSGAQLDIISSDNTLQGSGDILGAINFFGGTGVGTYAIGAKISAVGGTDWSGTDRVSSIRFSQNFNGTLTLNQVGEFTNHGNFGVGTTSRRTQDLGRIYIEARTSDSTATAFRIRNSGTVDMMQVRNDGLFGLGVLAVGGQRVTIRGATTGSTDFALQVQDSGGTVLFNVRNDGGFNFKGGTVGLAQTGYVTFTNLTTYRTCDANNTTIDELADILGTLIVDLKTKGIIAG